MRNDKSKSKGFECCNDLWKCNRSQMLEELPRHILWHILEYCNAHSLANVSLVSREIKSAVYNSIPFHWQRLLSKDFGHNRLADGNVREAYINAFRGRPETDYYLEIEFFRETRRWDFVREIYRRLSSSIFPVIVLLGSIIFSVLLPMKLDNPTVFSWEFAFAPLWLVIPVAQFSIFYHLLYHWFYDYPEELKGKFVVFVAFVISMISSLLFVFSCPRYLESDKDLAAPVTIFLNLSVLQIFVDIFYRLYTWEHNNSPSEWFWFLIAFCPMIIISCLLLSASLAFMSVKFNTLYIMVPAMFGALLFGTNISWVYCGQKCGGQTEDSDTIYGIALLFMIPWTIVAIPFVIFIFLLAFQIVAQSPSFVLVFIPLWIFILCFCGVSSFLLKD